MANNIVALNLNGNEYNFRPLYSVESSDSLGADYSFELSDFAAVDGATFLLYFTAYDLRERDESITFQTTMDGDRWWRVFYGTNELAWKDLVPYNLYEFSCHVDSDGFYLTGNIPYSPIKYRDNKNQLQEKSIGNGVIDLSSGVYYATTSATASRVANTLTLIDANGDPQIYNGSEPIDLSDGVNYAATAGSAPQDHYKNSVSTTAGTNSSGSRISIPHITTNGYGHVTNLGTRTHNVSVQKISKFCSVAGGQNKDKYFYIGSVLCDQAWSGYHANLSFVGAEAAWSGILYFGFRLGSTTTQFSGVELKWLSLTRSDISDKIIMTYADETGGRRVNLYFKYPTDYLTTSISIISEGESAPKPFIFNGAVSSSLIGTVYKTSSIDSNSSSLETTVSALVAENQKQAQQIADLKSVLNEIVTGKTWDSSIWS